MALHTSPLQTKFYTWLGKTVTLPIPFLLSVDCRSAGVDCGACLYLLPARWLSVTNSHKDTHNNEQRSLANATHQPNGMQSLRLEGHILLSFSSSIWWRSTKERHSVTCISWTERHSASRSTLTSKPSKWNPKGKSRWAQSYREALKTTDRWQWGAGKHPTHVSPVHKEQGHGRPLCTRQPGATGCSVPLFPAPTGCTSCQHLPLQLGTTQAYVNRRNSPLAIF